MTRETIILTKQEQQRAHVLSRVQDKTLTVSAAAALMGLSIRHVRRLLAEIRAQGPAALAHANRGRVSPRRLAEEVRTRILTLARTTYGGVNDHQLTELLGEREDIHVSRKTVQRLLRGAGQPSPRHRRPPKHRRRRERMPQAGLLVQMDGSHHPWLEDRGPRLVLHAAIDDATGEVLGGVFRPEEDAHGYFLLLRQLIGRYGLPAAAYTDRHGIFHRNRQGPEGVAEQLEGDVASTQVGRALQELGIKWIPASSPQGKGRVERLFGTFQDRLVVELRLANASTLTEAQRVFDRYRRRFNARFQHAPAHATPAWRPAPPDLTRICCFKHRRTVAHDNTIQFGQRVFQLHAGPGGHSYAGARIDVHVHLDDTMAIYHRGQRLRATALRTPPRPGMHLPKPPSAATTPPVSPARKPSRPAPDHVWRRAARAAVRRKQLATPRGDTFTDPVG
jgi:transposase